MKLRVTSPAARELDQIGDFLRARSPQAARRVEDALQEALTLLASYPHVGHELRDGVRRLTLPRYPYLIFYSVNDAEQVIDVLAVRHAARQREH